MSEILQGIRLVKLYAWEQKFEDKVSAFRRDELKKLKGLADTLACLPLIAISPFHILLTFKDASTWMQCACICGPPRPY